MARTHEFEIKEDDTLPLLETVLLDGNGEPVDLTAAVSVKFSMRLDTHPRTIVLNEVAAAFSPTASGEVSYAWAAGNTATEGLYVIEWVVRWGAGGRATFPSKGFDKVRVGPRIE